MRRVMCASLEPVPNGLGEWQWNGADECEGSGNYDGDIIWYLEDQGIDWNEHKVTHKFDGLIHYQWGDIVLSDADETRPYEMYWVEDGFPAKVSLSGGRWFYEDDEIDDILEEMPSWETLCKAMDEYTMEKVQKELGKCSNREFLARYLELAPCDLIVG